MAPKGDPVEMLAAHYAALVLGGSDCDECMSHAAANGWITRAKGYGLAFCVGAEELAGWLACQIVNGHHPITGEPLEE